MHPIHTARLFLRPLAAGDEDLYCRLYADPVVMRHIAPVLLHDAALCGFRSALQQQGAKRLSWIITERGTGIEHGLLGVVADGAQAEIGVMLFEDSQARGIACEAIPAVAAELFRAPALARLWTRHATANDAAAALMRHLAFEPWAVMGQPVGERRWHLTRERCLRNHAPMAARRTSG